MPSTTRVEHESEIGHEVQDLMRLEFPKDKAGRRAHGGFVYQHLYVLRLMRRLIAQEIDAYVCENGSDFLTSKKSQGSLRFELIEVKSRSRYVFGRSNKEPAKALQKLADRARELAGYHPKASVVCRLVFSRGKGNAAKDIDRLNKLKTRIEWPPRCDFEPEPFIAAEPTVAEMREELRMLCESEPNLEVIFTDTRNRKNFLESLLGLTVPFHSPRCVHSLTAWLAENRVPVGEPGQDTAKAFETIQSAVSRVLECSAAREKNRTESAVDYKSPIPGVRWGLPPRRSIDRGWWELGGEFQARQSLHALALVSPKDPALARLLEIHRNNDVFAAKLNLAGLVPLQKYLACPTTTHRSRVSLILSFARAVERWTTAGLMITADFLSNSEDWFVRDSGGSPEFVCGGCNGLLPFERRSSLLDCRWVWKPTLAAVIRALYFEDVLSTEPHQTSMDETEWNDWAVLDAAKRLDVPGFIHASEFRRDVEMLFLSERNHWPIFISAIDPQFLRDVLNAGKSSPLEALCEAHPETWQIDRGRYHPEILYARCGLGRGLEEVQIGLLANDDYTFTAYRYWRYGVERWISHKKRDRDTATPIMTEDERSPVFVLLQEPTKWHDLAWHVFGIERQELQEWLTITLTTVRRAARVTVSMPKLITQEYALHEIRRAQLDALRGTRFQCRVIVDAGRIVVITHAREFKSHITRCGYRLDSIEGLRVNAEDDEATRVRGKILPGVYIKNGMLHLPIEPLLDSADAMDDFASFELVDRGTDAIVNAEQALFNALRASYKNGSDDIDDAARMAWKFIETIIGTGTPGETNPCAIDTGKFRRVHKLDAVPEDDIPSAILNGFILPEYWQVLTGAPGTGKTSVVAKLAARYLDQHKGRDFPPCRVLVVANTHWAIENFLNVFEKGEGSGHLVLRAITPMARTRISEENDIRRRSIDERDDKFNEAVLDALPPVSSETDGAGQLAAQRLRLTLLRDKLREAAEQAEEYRNGCIIPSHLAWRNVHGFPSTPFAVDLGRTGSIVDEMLRGLNAYESSEQFASPGMGQVGDLRVFAAELVAATVDGLRRLPDMGFDLVIFEEASQINITAMLKVLTQVMRGRGQGTNLHVVLSGDPQQLPPYIEQHLPKCVADIDPNGDLRRAHKYARSSPSLFSIICENNKCDTKCLHTLTFQHRMHSDIATLVSNLFYKDQLWRCLRNIGEEESAVWWIDTTEFGEEPEREFKGTSWLHNGELEIVGRLHAKHHPGQFLAITPYRAQRKSLEVMMGGSGSCCTVDGCQGIEAETVVFSFVRMDRFALVSQRLNVALSRARKRLYLVGNFAKLRDEANMFKRPHVCSLVELFSSGGIFADRIIKPNHTTFLLP